jgi:hypothetical protein
MAKQFPGGIAFGQKSGAVFINAAHAGSGDVAIQPIRPTIKDESSDKSTPWARWGSDNKLPMQMAADIETCGILDAIIDGKARFGLCNGLLPALVHYNENGETIIDEIVTDPEIMDFLEDNNHFFQTMGWMKDLCGFGNGVARILLNLGRDKITAFQRDDITEMRYEKMNPSTGIIENILLSADWDKIKSINDNRIRKINLLNPSNPLADLRNKIKTTSHLTEFAITFKYPTWNKKYYSMPRWYAAREWVKIAQGIPSMKAAMFANNMRPKYMVMITQAYWSKVFSGEGKAVDDYTEQQIQEKKQALYDEIDQYLAGNDNAYKTVFCDSYTAPDGTLHPEIEITPIEDTTKQGELLPDSAAANSEIAFSMLFNPAIIGASMPSGPYTNSQGGSNVREATLIQVIIHELERRNIRTLFNLIKRFNGWDKAAFIKPGTTLEFIIPATIPTTLDTGSNVKPMVTGISPNKTDSNGTD